MLKCKIFKNNLYSFFRFENQCSFLKRTCSFSVQFVIHTFDEKSIVRLQNCLCGAKLGILELAAVNNFMNSTGKHLRWSLF